MKQVRILLFTLLISIILSVSSSAFAISNTIKDSDEEEIKEITNAKIGDYLCFGAIEQDNNLKNGTESIEWLVLDADEERILVISKYALDMQPYDSGKSDGTWESCSLRKWLNITFLNDAFTQEEQKLISTVSISAVPEWNGNTEENETSDKIFLLSLTEIEDYFASLGQKRECLPTEFAYAKNPYPTDEGDCLWWTRSSAGMGASGCAIATREDAIDSGFYLSDAIDINFERGVRPALWITVSTKGHYDVPSSADIEELGDSSKIEMPTKAARSLDLTNSPKTNSNSDVWYCPKCGNKNTDNYCLKDGTPRPSDASNSSSLEITYVDKDEFKKLQSTGDFLLSNSMLFELELGGGIHVYVKSKTLTDKEEQYLSEISSWTNIKEICKYSETLIALTEDGDVLIPSSMSSDFDTAILDKNLTGISKLSPVLICMPSYCPMGLIGMKNDGSWVWIIQSQSTYALRDNQHNALTEMLNKKEVSKVYYHGGAEGWTALLTNGTVISTCFHNLNGLQGIKDILWGYIYAGPIGMIALSSDGDVIIDNVSDGAEVDSRIIQMRKEISSWKNVDDITTYFDYQKVAAILFDCTFACISYDDISSTPVGSYTKYSDSKDALAFTSVGILKKDGTLTDVISYERSIDNNQIP